MNIFVPSKKCAQCGTPLEGRQKKFCCKTCSNIYNAEVFREQHKEENPNRYTICDTCGIEKNLEKFSLLDKTRITGCERKPTCKQCSAARREKEKRDRGWQHNSRNILWKGSRARAKQAGIEYTITKEDIVIPEYCPVLGIKLHREDRATWYAAPSIDRIDNTKGYIPGNIVIVSRRANILKRDATIEELVLLAKYYKQYGG